MTDCNPDLFGTPPLRGEAAEGSFGMQTGDGVQVDATRAIFPIIRVYPEGQIDLLGTGFFISNTGLFATARHVLQAAFDHRTGQQIFSVSIAHFHEEGSYIIRPVLRFAPHSVADVAVGVAAPMTRDSDGAALFSKVLTLTTAPVDPGAHVVTFAYPRYENVRRENVQVFNVMPTYYDGHIIEYLPDGRDRVLLPGPCYRTNIAIHHGASGGPVFSRSGALFALNSTGFDGTDDSYISSISPILDLVIDDVAMDNQPSRSVPVREIAKAGHIIFKPPI
jgi:hypothetical protein